MDKRTKRQIDKKVLDFERERLIEMLFESEDENVKDALEQALMTVKLIHSEEIAEEVAAHMQKLVEEAKSAKKRLSEVDRLIKEMRHDRDEWKKTKIIDHWDIFRGRPKWINDDYKNDRWITTSTISIDSPKIAIDLIKQADNWSIKLGKK